MYLIFDGVSQAGYLGLYDSHNQCIAHESLQIYGNESSKTLEYLVAFLTSNSVSYEDITEIFCVVGPGSFTGVRAVTLIVNTLAFVYPHIGLTGVSFFDLYTDYPILKQSSKRDVFVKDQKSATIEIVKNEEVLASYAHKPVYGDVGEELSRLLACDRQVDYGALLERIEKQHQTRLDPLYIKRPNIS